MIRMFESAAIRMPGLIGDRLDFGRVLEAMLYYGRVHLVMDVGFFIGAYQQLGASRLEALLKHDLITADVTPEFAGVVGNSTNGVVTHTPVFARFAGNEQKRIAHDDISGILTGMLKRGDPLVTRKDVDKILRHARPTEYKKILGSEAQAQDIFKSLAEDSTTLKLFAEAAVNQAAANAKWHQIQAADIRGIHLEGGGITIISPGEPAELAGLQGKNVTWSSVLAKLNDYAIDLHLARKYSSDVISSPEVASVADKRLDLSLNRASRNSERIHAFEEAVFGNASYFGGAFNDGNISFDDALKVIDKSRKFRQWSSSLPPDANLIHEYHTALARETTLGSLPGSIARFSFFTGTGVLVDAVMGSGGLGTTTGLGLSVFDSFVLDRITKGWRPNVFVENVTRAVQRHWNR
ncbi:hypothetical protein [Caulobacter sp. 17J65-9]|uniref:hypothetical protein n=1 Tax=Caulobacter sp. 17J65-9 TaxID=2709382 RepID=UPI0013C8C8BE|nr:hypothetical protein [Caulobacter sp. 17J65-9]NEX94159.1 hypothetical protein [Caulobacter sp. 17J65-9]